MLKDERNLDLSGDMQLGRVQLQQAVQTTEHQDGDDDGEVSNQGTQLEHAGKDQVKGGRGGGGSGRISRNITEICLRKEKDGEGVRGKKVPMAKRS